VRGPYWKIDICAGGTCVHDKVSMGVTLLLMALDKKVIKFLELASCIFLQPALEKKLAIFNSQINFLTTVATTF